MVLPAIVQGAKQIMQVASLISRKARRRVMVQPEMMNAPKISPIACSPLPVPSARRGACPSLDAPMATGDGLLVRLRPLDGSLTPRQFAAIATAAKEFGNGLLEVTARGNLQVRGLDAETAPAFAQAILSMDMPLSSGVAIETPPLAGIDPGEILDPRPLADVLRQAIETHVPPLRLAPKLSITVDAGGRFHLGGIVADIRLSAVRPADGAVTWRLSLAGNARTARPVALLAGDQVIDAVIALLCALDALGPAARGRNLDVEAWRHHFAFPLADAEDRAEPAPLPVGIHAFDPGQPILGVGLSFCQIEAPVLTAFLAEMEKLGAGEIRLAPEHGFFFIGIAPETIDAAHSLAAAHGLRISATDPANAIALCAGARGCASAFFDTHALARTVITEAPSLLDGSLTLHLSGCPKGCAHPTAAGLTLTAAPTGYGLVVNGSASGSPDAYIAAKDVTSAFRRLAALVDAGRRPGETAAASLERLGAGAIGQGLQRDRE